MRHIRANTRLSWHKSHQQAFRPCTTNSKTGRVDVFNGLRGTAGERLDIWVVGEEFLLPIFLPHSPPFTLIHPHRLSQYTRKPCRRAVFRFVFFRASSQTRLESKNPTGPSQRSRPLVAVKWPPRPRPRTYNIKRTRQSSLQAPRSHGLWIISDKKKEKPRRHSRAANNYGGKVVVFKCLFPLGLVHFRFSSVLRPLFFPPATRAIRFRRSFGFPVPGPPVRGKPVRTNSH